MNRFLGYLSTVIDLDSLSEPIFLRAILGNPLNNVKAFYNFTKDDVFLVKPWSWDDSYVELRRIGVFLAQIRHDELERPVVVVFEVFIVKEFSIDGFSTGAISLCYITSLDEVMGLRSVEYVPLIV